MALLTDLFSLLSEATAIFSVRTADGFWSSVAVGLLLAALCWYACHWYARLWNRRFQLRITHHTLCTLAGLTALAFSVLYPAVRYVGDAAEASSTLWEIAIRGDSNWADTTFREAYEAVRRLGVEDFRGVPPAGSPSSWIPTTSDQSRQEAAAVYASAACRHFARSRPFVSKIVWARPGVPADIVFADVQRWHQTNPQYPPDRAIQLAAEQIRAGLIRQVPRLVSMFRVATLLLFILAQTISFGVVGWAAYRDIKVPVSSATAHPLPRLMTQPNLNDDLAGGSLTSFSELMTWASNPFWGESSVSIIRALLPRCNS